MDEDRAPVLAEAIEPQHSREHLFLEGWPSRGRSFVAPAPGPLSCRDAATSRFR